MKFLKFKTKQEASQYVSNIIIANINENPYIKLGLATGSTPILMYECLTKDYEINKTDWSNVITFNLDEYIGLEYDHPQSYHYFMKNILFRYVNINIENTFFPDSNNNYDELIKKNDGIDLQILGIGTNGHIGFNEPGSPIDSLTRKVDLSLETIEVNSHSFFKGDKNKVPKQAYSMGVQSILNAKKIILLAFGNTKHKTIKDLLNIKEFDINNPASALINHKDVTIVIDEEVDIDL